MTLLDTTTVELDRLLRQAQREGRLPSVTAGVIRGGELVWRGAVGTLNGRADGIPADCSTQYRMGSITKTFVAVAVMRLVEQGRVDLSDPVAKQVHDLPEGLARVTVEQLLSHASGLQSETSGPWWERVAGMPWAALLESGIEGRFRSGRRFHYSNTGYAVLGQLLQAVDGRTWSDLISSDLLEPLGMERTSLRPLAPAAEGLAVHPFADVLLTEPEHDAAAMAPAGQLWSTVDDLARWAAFLAGRTQGLLRAETLAEMLEPHHVVDEPGEPWTAAHGLGWQVWNVDGVRYAGHGGSMPGFLAALRVQIDTGDGVVVLTNTTASPVLRRLTDGLLLTMTEREPHPEPEWSAAGSAALLELTGLWHWGPLAETATLDGDQLVLGEPGTRRGSRFTRTGGDTWVGLDGYYTGEPLTVVRRPDGTVSHLDIASFRFTRIPYDATADIPGGVDDAGWR